MKVAVVQMNAQADTRNNMIKAMRFIRQAVRRQARFVVFPEGFLYRPGLSLSEKNFLNQNGKSEQLLRPLAEEARRAEIFILAGSIYEKSRRQRKTYNTSVLINPKGNIVAKYRKRHLFITGIYKKQIKEEKTIFPGKKGAVADVFGMKIGLTICYDLRFSRDYRAYRKQGVRVFCVPSCFTKKTGKAHWEILLRARAIENLCYVVAPNQVGKDAQGVPAYGHSMIVDPWGRVLAKASANKEEMIIARLSQEEIQKVRRFLPGV